MKRFLTFLRRLFRLPYPHYSRRELGVLIQRAEDERNRLRNQLAAAVINGQWSINRPLAAHIPGCGPLRSRFPRLTEHEIQKETAAILGGYFGQKFPEPKETLLDRLEKAIMNVRSMPLVADVAAQTTLSNSGFDAEFGDFLIFDKRRAELSGAPKPKGLLQ